MSLPAPAPVARRRSSPIRVFEPDDLPAVARLYARALPGATLPVAQRAAGLARVLDHPWADPDLPSLVYADPSGQIGGFLASHVRRVTIDGEPLRLACSGPLVVDPALRNRTADAQLTRAHVEGEQDITIADAAAPPLRRMWETLGAVTAQSRSLEWIKVLRPASLASELALSSRGRPRAHRVVRRAAAAPDALLLRAARLAHSTLHDEPLTPALMLAHHARLTIGARLRPDYDEAYLRWLFGELRAARTRGELVARMVSGESGAAMGWFVAHMPKHGVARVLQVVARPRDMGTVFNHMLLRAARDRAAIAVRGRLEPQLLEAVAEHRCVLRHAGGTLLHARDPDLAAVAASSSAALTLLDGDSWMEPHRP